VGSVLVDGFVGGMWRITRERGKAILMIEAGSSWTKADLAAVVDEGGRLLVFVASDKRDRDIQVTVNQ
jgi:hypothetical protein